MDEVEQLIANALDWNCLKRVEVVNELGKRSDRRAVEPLVCILASEKENLFVRYACIGALGNLGDERSLDILADIAQQHDALNVENKGIRINEVEVRKEAVRALGKLVCQENKDSGDEMGIRGSLGAVRILIMLIETKSVLMDTASQALGQMPRVSWHISDALNRSNRNGNDPEVRFALTRALCHAQGFPLLSMFEVKKRKGELKGNDKKGRLARVPLLAR